MTTLEQSMTMKTQLGVLISEHGVSQVRNKGNLWGGIVFIILGVVALAVGLIAAVSETGASVVGFCGAAGLLSIAGGAWAVWTQRQEKEMAVQVYQNGIMSAKNGRITIMRWEDVSHLGVIVIYNQQLRSSFYTYTLKDFSGQALRLNLTPGNFENATQLAQIIQQEVTRRQLPRAMADFNAGVPLRFGPLTVTQEGIENGRKTLPWSEVAEVEFGQRGYFVVRAQQKATTWARVDMVKMTNPFILMALANHKSAIK